MRGNDWTTMMRLKCISTKELENSGNRRTAGSYVTHSISSLHLNIFM